MRAYLLNLVQNTHNAYFYLFCFLTGAITIFAQAPLSFWFMAFLTLPVHYLTIYGLQVNNIKLSKAFRAGFFFALGYFFAGLYWVSNAMFVQGYEHYWMLPLSFLGLPVLLSLFMASATTLVYKFFPLDRIQGFLSWIALIALFEWLRGNVFSGFPWHLYAYIWSDTVIYQSLSLFGAYGLTFLSLFWLYALGYILVRGPKASSIMVAVVAVVTLGLCYGYGVQRLQTENEFIKDVSVRLVQPNIPQEIKWQQDKRADIVKHTVKLSQPFDQKADERSAAHTTLIIWPETAISDHMILDPTMAIHMSNLLKQYEKPAYLISGHLRYEGRGETLKIFNSLTVFDQAFRTVHNYDKSHLVPFGEYVPFQEYIPLAPVARYTGFTQGNGPENIDIDGRLTYTGLICYEVIFPVRMVKDAANPPDFLVNATNDGWYGTTAGPYQHFAITRARAIEEGLSVIRSANTGISSVIDPFGRTLTYFPLLEVNSTLHDIPKGLSKRPLYSLYKETFFWAAIFIFLFVSLGLEIRRRRNP